MLPLVALFALFAREREARIDGALELSSAYKGTALLLGDVIEADDQYTGEHTKDVVELTLQVADALGVDEETRRGAEFGALLHDVGKIRIPDAIINKPGPLDDDEWAVMKTHTVEGQRMLERVGGVLARVGEVVRASHERWDGGGYPDGLAGEDIPLAARIVSACDAYNAMTTDRSYRRALPVADAVAELERCAGTQFDPAVVAALIAVAVGSAPRVPDWQLTLSEPDPAGQTANARTRRLRRAAVDSPLCGRRWNEQAGAGRGSAAPGPFTRAVATAGGCGRFSRPAAPARGIGPCRPGSGSSRACPGTRPSRASGRRTAGGTAQWPRSRSRAGCGASGRASRRAGRSARPACWRGRTPRA